jgi:hypothetical protein
VEFNFLSVKVEVTDWYTTTIFEDGIKLVSDHKEQPGQRERARQLGYSSAEEMNYEHDLTHTLLAIMAGKDWSPTLRGIATGETWPAWQDEEAAVLGFQCYMNRLGVDVFTLAKKVCNDLAAR